MLQSFLMRHLSWLVTGKDDYSVLQAFLKETKRHVESKDWRYPMKRQLGRSEGPFYLLCFPNLLFSSLSYPTQRAWQFLAKIGGCSSFCSQEHPEFDGFGWFWRSESCEISSLPWLVSWFQPPPSPWFTGPTFGWWPAPEWWVCHGPWSICCTEMFYPWACALATWLGAGRDPPWKPHNKQINTI